jgi:hypothetical protein
VNCGTLPDVFAAGVSINAAVRISSSIGTGEYRNVVSSRAPSTATPFSLDVNSNSGDNGGGRKLRFYVNNGGFNIWQSSGVVPVSEWSLVEVAYTPGANPRMWINGVAQTVSQTFGGSQPSILYSANSLRIGAFEGGGGSDGNWLGEIQFVQLHNVGLVHTDYDQWRRGFPDLLARVPRRAVAVAAGGGGGFQSAWAAGSNVVLTPAVF